MAIPPVSARAVPLPPVASRPGFTPPTAPQKATEAQQTAQKFEAVYLGQMTQLMMQSVETGDEFSGGHGEEMFRGVLAEKLGTEMARTGGVGLAPSVLAQIIKMQGGSGNAR
ncbi:MAG: rod-binding protein [Sphingomonas sp.]